MKALLVSLRVTNANHARGDIVEALREFNGASAGLQPWMDAAALARRVGATSAHDPQFEADVHALYEAGTIRLMSGGNARGSSFYSAMLVPPDDAPLKSADESYDAGAP